LSREFEVLVLNPPSPPHLDVSRDWAGGFGTARPAKRRADFGHSGDTLLYPFLPYAAAVLSHEGCSYKILDCQRLRFNRLEMFEQVKRQSPDMVFSLTSLPSLEGDLRLMNMIKEALPDTFVVAVGTTCHFLYSNILKDSKIDAVSTEGYPYVSNLAYFLDAFQSRQDFKRVPNVSYVEEKKIVRTSQTPDCDLSTLLPPDYDDLELDGYEHFEDLDGNRYGFIPIIGSKGCPYPCDYCPYPLGLGRRWTYRSAKSIADEIEGLHSRGVKGFLFRDQSFVMSRRHATDICKEIIRRKLEIAWFCEARADQISVEILEIMKKAGCKQIHYGVETGDPDLIKQGKPHTDLDTIRKAFQLTKRAELFTTAHVILGWPYETIRSLEQTARFIEEINPDDVNWSMLTPYPGTPLRKIAEENNLILTDDWSRYTSYTVVMKTRYLSAEQLSRAKEKIIRDHSRRRLMKLLFQIGNRHRFVLNELKKTIKNYFM
jgi:anaerobic magnesium-protoporphyrin IX monomethyl ester cyclase